VTAKMNELQGGEAHFFEESLNPAKVKEYLARSTEPDKLKGMKWLLAMMSKGKDVAEFFSDVVKNVVARSVEVKKMVYIYLVHYADANATCRELALLSINSFQKDLAAPNQLIRALALRVMTSIRVPDIIQIQMLAVKKCAGDSSPYVRKCAASAVPKIFVLDREQGSELCKVLQKLLQDNSTMVLGSAVAAFSEVCPHNYALLHPAYRTLCHLLADIDEWGQIIVLNVLTRYVRTQFTNPNRLARSERSAAAAATAGDAAASPLLAAAAALQTGTARTNIAQGRGAARLPRRRVVRKAFYSDEEDASTEEDEKPLPRPLQPQPLQPGTSSSSTTTTVASTVEQQLGSHLDDDHRLVLKSSLPLLKSRNSGVVLAVCALHHYCGTHSAVIEGQLAKVSVYSDFTIERAYFLLYAVCIRGKSSSNSSSVMHASYAAYNMPAAVVLLMLCR
jgi:AP-3 complex subunit beta